MHSDIKPQGFKPKPKANYIRILALLVMLAIVATVALLAYDEYEPYYESEQVEVQGEYIYESEHGYEDYNPYPYEYEGHEYSHEYYEAGYEYDGYANYYGYENENEYEYGYDESHYDYDESGYIGDAPYYTLAETTEFEGGPVYIYFNDDGNIVVDPDIAHSVTFYDTGYIGIRVPYVLNPESISLTLPYDWTYIIEHEHKEAVDSGWYNDYGVWESKILSEANTYTVITISHTLFGTGGSFGIMPFVLNPPGGFGTPQNANSHLTLVNAIGGDLSGSRIVNVTGPISQTATIDISGNRHVIIVSQGTNMGGNLTTWGAPSVTQTISHTGASGRHFTVSGGATLTLSHIILNGGSPVAPVARGGVEVAGSNTRMYMHAGTIIENCRNWGRGGGVNVSNNAVFTMNAGHIRNNHAVSGGGGVSVGTHILTQGTNPQFIMNNGIISHNTVIATTASHTGRGGGVKVSAHPDFTSTTVTFTMNDGIIEHNYAIDNGTGLTNCGWGGGVSVEWRTHFIMNDGQIRYNTAVPSAAFSGRTGIGGGVNVVTSLSTFHMHGGIIRDNTALAGGGVDIASVIMNMTNGTITANQATNGGGVNAISSTLTMSNNARITDNDATSTHVATGGGGIDNNFNAIPIVGANPGPSGNGGGIHATDTTITMNNSARIDNNRTTTSFTNEARPNGLPAVQPYPSTAIPGAPILTPNFSNHGNGGGIFITGSSSTLTMNHNIRIDHNSAAATMNNTGAVVVGVQLGGFEIRPTIVGNGGGIFASDNAVVQITAGSSDVQIYRNRTSSTAGGYSPTVAMVNPTTGQLYTREEIVARRRINMPITTGSGAGAFIHNGATFHMPTGVIHTNTANASANTGGGAGVFVNAGGTLNMSNNALIGADAYAGGNRMDTGSGGTGAGVFVNAANVHMTNDARISFNLVAIPQAGGGGMHVAGASTVTMSDNTRINNNIGGLQGGGVNMMGGNFTMSGNAVIENNHVVAGNSGGGVHVNAGFFTMTSPTNEIRNHTVGATPGTAVISNQYIRTGAGVQVGGTGHFRLMEGRIHSNRSRQFAAGVRVFGNGRFDMHSGEITNNHISPEFGPASGGAGVFVESAAPTPPTMAGFNMMGGRIHNNSVLAPLAVANDNRGGGGVRINSGFFRFNGGEIENNRVYSPGIGNNVGGGGVFMAGGTFFMGNVPITAAVAPAPPSGATYGNGTGGAIRQHNQTATLVRGGGVFLMGNATFNIGGGTNVGGAIYNNTANFGGGIYVTGVNAQLNIGTGALIETNRAQNGGGVNINNSIVNMTGGDIREHRNLPSTNNPILEGGGVRVAGSNAVFTMSGGMIGHATNNAQGNRSHHGAGVWVGAQATFDMSGGLATTRIMRNESTGVGPPGGGGVQVTDSGSELNMTGGTIAYNTAANGGGVNIIAGGDFYMNGGSVRHNQALDPGGATHIGAGGVRVGTGSTFEMQGNSEIRNNFAEGNGGGGVRIEIGASFTMYDGYVLYNRSVQTAGGVFANGGTFIMHDGEIRANTAEGTNGGGGIDVIGQSNSVIHGGLISDNRAIRGAGITVRNAHLAMHGGDVVNNRFAASNAAGIGSGTISEGGGVWVGWNANTSFTMTGGTIGHATISTQGNRAIRGGGVWVGSGASFIMQPTGGVAGPVPTDPLTIATAATGGFILNNENRVELGGSANGDGGGGVAVIGGGATPTTFTMNAGVIGNNRTSGTNPTFNFESIASGGGVLVADTNAIFTMNNGIIRDNTNPSWSGAGVTAAVNGQFIMNNGVITGNVCDSSGGGGIASRANATVTINNGRIHNNTAITGGGILAYNYGNVTINDGIIENNLTPNLILGGGGITIFSGSHVTMNGGIIRNHTVVNEGGGVRISNPPNPSFHRPGNSSFTMTGGRIYNNQGSHGGGVWISGTNLFTMTGGTIGGARPAGLPGAVPNPYANTAGNGGGVWVGNEASFYMLPGVVDGVQTHGSIMGNSATNSVGLANGGGGVHVNGHGSEFTMRAGVIGGDAGSGESNTATRGGGVHVSGPAIFRMEAGSVTIGGSAVATHGRISGNIATGATASDGGGGVFMFHLLTLLNPTHRAQFFLEAGIIGGNSNDDEGNTGQHGGGVFIHSNGTMTISGGRIIGNRAIACGGGINLGANIHDNNLIMTGGIIGGGIDGEGNTAGTDGGGVRVGINSVFEMEDGRIIGNKAVNGGGVVVLTDSVFNMRSGSIGSATNENEGNSAITGGGVSVGLGWIEGIATATSFNMYGGTIGNNTADYGGGVYVNDNVEGNVFNLRGTNAKVITANEAEYNGGGVWVAEDAEMIMQAVPQATNVSITYNIAGEMGGGIFTGRHEYANPLTRYTGSPLLGAQTVAYSNLTIHNVIFNNNQANRRYIPPINALNVLGTGTFNGTSIPATPTPIRVHTLNNFDINFHAPGILFEFHKTNQQIFENPRVAVLLPEARFALFRAETEELGGTGSGGLVPADITGTPWQLVEDDFINNLVSTNLNNTPISFYMTPGFIYQLVEYQAPNGFQVPMGQWRIRPPETNPNTITLAHIEHIGGISIPGFISNSGANNFSSIPIDWFLGNRPDLGLPLTGGLGFNHGTMSITAAGLALIAGAMAVVWYTIKVRKRRLSPVVNRKKLDS